MHHRGILATASRTKTTRGRRSSQGQKEKLMLMIIIMNYKVKATVVGDVGLMGLSMRRALVMKDRKD